VQHWDHFDFYQDELALPIIKQNSEFQSWS